MSAGVPRPVRRAAGRAARGWGTATSRWRPLPDFLVVGTKRGGTTSMFRALEAHPGVVPMVPAAQGTKSPHYFDLHHDRGERWYRSHFATGLRRRTGPDGRRPLTGEASPYYLFHPHAAARIAAVLPDARLVVMLRDPVDRAFSHHWDRTKAGVEHLPFAEAVAAEPDRLDGELDRMLDDPDYQSEPYEHFSYLARGRYAEQLERLFAHVPRRQVLVLRSEDFYERPDEQYRRTLDHLGLAPHRHDQFRRLHGHADRPDVPADLRAELAERFAPHNAELAALLGTPVWW